MTCCVTNGIYKILNAPRLAERRGDLCVADAKEMLDAGEYPAAMHGFLFDLMKKFELCFSFPDADGRYLIPELLTKDEPELGGEFEPPRLTASRRRQRVDDGGDSEGADACGLPLNETGCLNFQYHYPVLPEGLMPRFIVRTHVLSEPIPQHRWRTGVVLQFEGNRALVKADVQDNKVFVSVAGPAAGRRRLLAVIRSDFESIHRGFFQKLEPVEMVPVPSHPDVVIPYRELVVMEESDTTEFPKVVAGKVLTLDVRELLNGVDIPLKGPVSRTTRLRLGFEAGEQPLRVFFSYSHKDEGLRNELETHLKLLQRQGLISSWHDRKIMASEDWGQMIDDNLEAADIILLLVSADFIASEYCYEKEMKRALERHVAGEARVIPVIVRDVNWQKAPFANIQALPKDALAVTKWPDRDSAWRNVAEGIERMAEEVRRKTGGG